MPRLRRSTSVVAVLLIGQSVAWAGVGQAQGRPSGESSRFWAELGVSAAAQVHRCVSCTGSATLGGASATAAAGVTLPNGFGIGVLGRTFGALFDFDSARRSRYVIALAQYAPPAASMLTLNVGGGGGRHTSDSQVAPTDGSGAVVYAGAALRLPPRGGLALSVTADVLQSIDGTPRSHPRLMSIGLALGAATSPPAPQGSSRGQIP